MKRYWFTLEMYVFIWQDKNQILVYNSLQGKGYLYHSSPALKIIVDTLQEPNNLYGVEIEESLMKDASVSGFIQAQRKTFCGNLIDADLFPQKPVTIIPVVYFNEETALTDSEKMDELSLSNSMKNLREICLQVTGECSGFCSCCSDSYRQYHWCHKTPHRLSPVQLQSIIQKLDSFNLQKIHILGGDLFAYPDWNLLLSVLKKISGQKIFYINHKSPAFSTNRIHEILSWDLYSVKILVNMSETDISTLESQLMVHERIKYVFSVTNVDEYDKVIQIMENNRIEGDICPYYNGNNQKFFSENVCLDREDILHTQWTRNQILANQKINMNHFGKLAIEADGTVYANINHPAIGSWQGDYKDFVLHELSSNLSWKKTRNDCVECKDCIFRYLCPPPSNYEYVIGRHNLCRL